MSCQGCSHGQRRGRWMLILRAERAMRPGTVMSWARIVAVVAFAWNFEARVPVARVRLNAIAARTVRALFAANDASGVFTANAAWTVAATNAFNLTRAAATLAGPAHARARTTTFRAQLIAVPARMEPDPLPRTPVLR